MAVYTLFGQSGGAAVNDDPGGYVLGMEFSLSAAAALTGIWFYSPPTAAILPDVCGIWDVSSQDTVAGTENTSPEWSGAAGSGWVKCAYDGSVTLAAATSYRVAVEGEGGVYWYSRSGGYWAEGGAGADGLTSGIITAPASADSDVGQDSYAMSTWSYPALSNSAPNYWVDVEVTAGAASGLLMASII
jgi:hypothetical protein